MRYLFSVGLLAGTIIGAGIFSIPYVFAQAGWAISLFYLFGFSIFVAIAHIFYADVILRTPERHRMPGYVRRYFGPAGFYASLAPVLLGMFFTLAVYLALAPSFFALFFGAESGIEMALIFWLSASLVVFLSISIIARAEFLATAGILTVLILVAFSTTPGGEYAVSDGVARFFQLSPFVLPALLFPFGPVLFSFAGRTAIPPVVEYLKSAYGGRASGATFNRIVRSAILLGTLLPAIAYLLFVFGIFGVSENIAPDAVSGIDIQQAGVRGLIGILGIGVIWSSYIVIGKNIVDTLTLDVHIPLFLVIPLLFFLPPVLFILGGGNFFILVALTGGIFLAIEQMIILMLWRKTNSSGFFLLPLLRSSRIRAVVLTVVFLAFLCGLAFQTWFFMSGNGV